MPFSTTDGIVGNQQVAFFGLPDTTARQQPGLYMSAVDNYWGGGEFIYCYAAGAIRQFGLVAITPSLVSGSYRYNAVEVPNTANLGKMVAVACTSMTTGQYGWVQISGVVPVNMTSSIAATTSFGIVAAGQGGTLAAGKQILNAQVIASAASTVVKAATAQSGAMRITVNDASGWFIGAYLSGTGIQATTTIVDIDPSGTNVTLSLATNAQINGNVTATYNNATVYYNICHINRPFAQGAIT